MSEILRKNAGKKGAKVKKTISNRIVCSAMVAVILIATAYVTAHCGQCPVQEGQGSEKIKVLFLGAGGIHDWANNVPLLAEVLRQTGDFEVTETPSIDDLRIEVLGKYDVLAIYVTGCGLTDKPEWEAGLHEFVTKGGGVVGIHSASDSFKDSDMYWEIMSGRFIGHGFGTLDVKIYDTDHPITKPIKSFYIQDETYRHEYHPNAQMRSLIRIERGNERQSMGWVSDYGKGKVFYTGLGHGPAAFNNPDFQRLVVRGFYWSAGHEIKDPPVHIVRHPIVVAGADSGKIQDVSRLNEVVFEHSAPGVTEVWSLCRNKEHPESGVEGGDLLFSDAGGVKRIDRAGKVVWEYKTQANNIVTSCQPIGAKTGWPARKLLATVLVAEGGNCQLTVLDKDGKVVERIPLKTSAMKASEQIRSARKLENGNYLVCHPGEGVVREYDKAGNVARTIAAPRAHTAIRLENGNTVISCGDKAKVIEVDSLGNVVWEISSSDVPEANLKFAAGIQCMENGNVIIANGANGKCYPVFEVTRDKKIMWKICDTKRFSDVSSFHMTSVNTQLPTRK